MTPKYPVVLWEIGPGDRGWKEGRRYRVDTLGHDQFFFLEEERAREFIKAHGMMQLDPPDMHELCESMGVDPADRHGPSSRL